MRSIHLTIASTAFLFFVAGAARPQSQMLEVHLLKDDAYVTRTMKVLRTSGEKVTGLATIRSFDPVSNSFIMEGVAGETKTIPVSDIERIEFEQDILRQSPAAQEAAWRVNATPGRMVMYEVPQASLSIQNGNLQLFPSWEVQPASGAPHFPELPGVSVTAAPGIQIAEAKILKYDAGRKVFSLLVQYSTYSRETFGGAGSSSGGKPLQ